MSSKSKGKNVAAELVKAKARAARSEAARLQAAEALQQAMLMLQLLRDQRRLMARVIARLLPAVTAPGETAVAIDFALLDVAPTVGFGTIVDGDTMHLVVMPPLAEDPDPGPVSRTAVIRLDQDIKEQLNGLEEVGGQAGDHRAEGEGADVSNSEA
jgi:hypothetical protein